MKTKYIVLATALLGGLLSASAFATTTAAHNQTIAALRFDAPVPARIVHPTDLPNSAKGATVMLSLTIDAAGQPHDIRIVSRGDRELTKSLVSAVSQWQFTPARKDGTAVTVKVLLPIELVEASASTFTATAPSHSSGPDGFVAPIPTSVVRPVNLPNSYRGETVRLAMTIDAAGQAHDIKVLSGNDRALTKSLVMAVSQWQFTPARQNGQAVSVKVELPLELVES